ncbi:MAG: hypothetical protein GY810_16965 [Aureispira sp.]|nr:hypothetical protein [Aureispira sp.]
MTNAKFLKNALLGNALFSIVSGLLIVIESNYLQELFGITFPFWLIGAGLLPFAAWILWIVRQEKIDQKQTKAVILADIMWVGGSIALLLMNLGITNIGNWIIGGLAIVVADFALLQSIGLRKIKQG